MSRGAHTGSRPAARLRDGAGDALSQAFELVATPAVFGLGGWYADRRLDTTPAITLAAVIAVFVYQMWRFASDYAARLDEALEERRAGYARPGGGDQPGQA